MSLVIRTTYGNTSKGNYPLTRKYSEIGASPDSDLILLDDVLPNEVCRVEYKSDSVQIYCKISNALRVGKELLNKGDRVVWSVGTILDVCGVVKLTLEENDDAPEIQKNTRQEPTVKRTYSGTFGLTRGSMATYASRATRSNVASMKSLPNSVNSETSVQENLPEKKKQNTTSYIVICLCAVVMMAMSFFTGGKPTNTGLDASDAYAILKSSDDYDVQLGDKDGKLAEQFQGAYLKEGNDSELALVYYQTLLSNVTVRYNEVCVKINESQKSEQEKDDLAKCLKSNYYKVNQFLNSRIDALNAKLNEAKNND